LLGILGVLLFIIFVLPYLLPLNGPATVDPTTLADPNGASSFSWRENLDPLAEAGFTVYAPEMRGFGLSDKGWDEPMLQDAQAARAASARHKDTYGGIAY
jgi:pimeloyl-ACP methyl ester carboxylesterase